MINSRFIKAICLSIGLIAFNITVTACTPDTGVKTTRVKKTADVKSKRTAIDRSELEVMTDNWKPVRSFEQTIETRNPFKGFTDTLLAENRMRQKMKEDSTANDVQLPEQLYNTRDYKVVGVITGTAEPKVYVVDPGGNRFVLRRGSRLGNKNGIISSIHRDGIEVYERVAEVGVYERVAEKGQYIELPLYEAKAGENKNIQLTLQ